MSKIRTRKRGKTYSYSFEIGNDPETGKRRMKEKGGYSSAKEAYEAGVEAYADWQHGNIGITSKKITFEKFYELWYENTCNRLRKNSQQQYTNTYKHYLKPYISQKYMQDITPIDIDFLLHKLVERGYAKSTLQIAYRLAHLVFKYAVYPAKIIQVNPTEYIQIPKVQKKEREHTIISHELFSEMVSNFNNKPYVQIIITIAYYTGMRIGEILGLTWDKISFEERTITIDSQMQGHVKSGYIEQPKTNAGVRVVYFGDVLSEKLKEWKQVQDDNIQKKGMAYQLAYLSETDNTIKYLPVKAGDLKGYRELQLVCTNEHGLSISKFSINRYLAQFGCSIHDFRHTHATKLIEGGVTPVGVAARLGHASAMITQDIYTHVTENMQRQTADVVDQVF